jgi:SPP1 gp7 family putative phage head morphogenesis protein
LQSLPYITRRKNIPKELFKELESTTYKVLLLSFLFGMVHVKEKEERELFFSDAFDATFEEAVEFMKEKLHLTPEEFYNLDAKARFKAFTVAKLTGLDAIERVKEKLTKAIEEGKTLKEWIEELGEDGILKAVGFHQSNPWYLETVFRTNISTAYNAGRLMQIQRSKDKIKYLEYVAIDDSRTTPICRRLDGTRLPPDDPFWATYTPPLHFNCRSTVRAIFKGSNEAKKVRKRKPKDIPPIPEGFAGSPLNSWWKLTDSMAKRVVKYGLKEEVLEKAKRMCGKDFEDGECPEFEEVRKKIEKLKDLESYIGKGERISVSEGDIISHPITGDPTEVAKKYKDILDNEKVLTKLAREHILYEITKEERPWRKEVRTWGLRNIHNVLRDPDMVLFDQKKQAILYCKKRKVGDKNCIAAVVVGAENKHYIYTVKPAPYPPSGLKSGRYVIIYCKEEESL